MDDDEIFTHPSDHVAKARHERLVGRRARGKAALAGLGPALGAGAAGAGGAAFADVGEHVFGFPGPVVALEIRQRGRGDGRQRVLAPALEKGVEEVGDVGDRPLRARGAQRDVVPFPEAVRPGCLLAAGVAVQNVVVALWRGGGEKGRVNSKKERKKEKLFSPPLPPTCSGGHAQMNMDVNPCARA